MSSRTHQNSVKAIFEICAAADSRLATTGSLARRLDISNATASKLIRSLSKAGLVEFVPYGGARLTSRGRRMALSVVRRHRLVELFLARVLKMDWHEVHVEAEQLEHAVSDALAERIDAFLGRPQADPHGDPIPSPDGKLPRAATMPLADCAAGSRFVVRRVLDQSPAALRYLSDVGLHVEEPGCVVSRSAAAEVMTLALGERSVTISTTVASRILVSADGAKCQHRRNGHSQRPRARRPLASRRGRTGKP